MLYFINNARSGEGFIEGGRVLSGEYRSLTSQYNGYYGVQTDPNGLLYMRARYYSPTLRRFLNADPIGFAGGMNWYAFANGNPIMYMDPSGLDYIGIVQYRAGAFIYGYGTFEGRLYHDTNPTDIIDVSGSLHGIGLQAGFITGKQPIRINADTPEEALGNQGGFFLADAGFGVGPVNIGGISGSIGAHHGDKNADFGKFDGEFTRPGISTTFDPINPGSYLEKPLPGFGFSAGFLGTRVKKANRYEPFRGYYQSMPSSSKYNFKTNIK